MKDISRVYRWTLLAASSVTLVYLLAAAVGENYFAEWRGVQRTYREHLRAKSDTEFGASLARNFQIELKQITIPQLGAVDRCVSCHNGIDDPRMTDVAVPHAVHSADTLEHHPADRYGCTICHRGQGAATNFQDAKADDVFWDYPMLPVELTQASCYTCHDTERLPTEQVDLLLEGMELYRTKGCGACHKLEGRGGALGPELDNVGSKSRHQLIFAKMTPPFTTWRWHRKHFRDPGAVVADTDMPNPTVTEREALALTVYMLALWERDVPESYLAPDKIEQKYRSLDPELHTGEQAGEQLYREYCTACHGTGTYGQWDRLLGKFIPAIRGPSFLRTVTKEYLKANITGGRPGTEMPSWGEETGGLQPAEIDSLVDYIYDKPVPEFARAEFARAEAVKGNAGQGAMLFAQNCSGCHGIGGRGGIAPELANPVFQQAAGDGFIATTIRNGRRATAMPAFQRPGVTGLTEAEISDLVAYVRSLAPAAGDRQSQTIRAKSENGNRVGGAL